MLTFKIRPMLFMSHRKSNAHAFILVHKGKPVLEYYPALHPTDHHVRMSVAKMLPSLVIDLWISDGKIHENQTIGFYVPEFRDSAWENIKVRNVMDMTPGLDSEDTVQTRLNHDSTVSRVFRAEFGMSHKGKQEILLDVLKGAKKVREPGTQFEYGSPTTQMLRDLARYGIFITASWHKVACEQVVTPEIIERIRKGVRSREFYRNSLDGSVFFSHLNDDAMFSNSRQWEAVWPDGDFWKAGIMSQALYVSPDKDLVITFFSVNWEDSIHRYLRPNAISELFNK